MKKMKKSIVVILMLTSLITFSQGKWVNFSEENEINIKITEAKNTFKINDLEFVSVWGNKIIPNEKTGHLEGIKNLKIFHKGKQLNEFSNIPDNIGLGYVVIRFYDYNFDGFLDFTIQVNCGGSCYSNYYLYDKKLKKFIYQKNWNIRIQKINKKEKLILTQPDGMEDSGRLFRVVYGNLIKMIQKQIR